ncbi:major tail protein [Mycobacterium phage Barnyard]|uniref:Fibronectin type-III domain-containing protein n=1 Tax=Mycobacterium phage Barnyard TaxID=205880 RepID=Q856E2_9CAUD|nr:major tail protein [Mycobacterium phage Barnyard]AAN02084.1 hypothetical protein PBI_BARNYARD_30 [Mycobacterium phage Barnyard]
MTAPVSTALPYGCNDVKLTEYIDASGQVLGPTSVDLPYIQTLNFAEAEEFQELRGDDKLITTRGRGASVNWDLESGGMATEVWAILTGGDVIERGLPPYREVEVRKRGTQTRPWFRIDGKIISDSGGDVLVRIYRCRANDNIQANFADGEFTTTSVSGVGYPLLDDTNDLLYSIFRRETSSAISLTPEPNPVQSPLNLTVGTVTNNSAQLLWTPVVGATEYGIYSADDEDGPFEEGTPATSVSANVTQTGLTAGPVWFQVTATVGGVESDPCPPILVTVPS